MIERIADTFRHRFGSDPIGVRAPGRINLIGEHTDYNDGFVLPAAIDREMYFALAPNGRSEVRLLAADLDQTYTYSLGQEQPCDLGWPNHIMGVTRVLEQESVSPQGFDCVFGGNIPIGAGLSSSAALEAGLLFGLDQCMGWGLSRPEMARLAQAAENRFVGVNCGVMDPFASLHGKAAQVFRLDCRSLDYAYFPCRQDTHTWILCNTQVSHSLAGSEYNLRRAQCEAGVAAIARDHPGVTHLRDVSPELLAAYAGSLEPLVFQRCAYVVEENQRVLQACEALAAEDWEKVGTLLQASHTGLSEAYEVSCPELDFLVDTALRLPGVLGARMMGGGFGGCTLNLVLRDEAAPFKSALARAYQQRFGVDPPFYQVSMVDGVSLLSR